MTTHPRPRTPCAQSARGRARSHHTYRKGRTAMRLAWGMIREGRPVYGGTVREYRSEALRIAWAEVKADPVILELDKIFAQGRAMRADPNHRQPRQSRYARAYYEASW